jgi:hypothetical protein
MWHDEHNATAALWREKAEPYAEGSLFFEIHTAFARLHELLAVGDVEQATRVQQAIERAVADSAPSVTMASCASAAVVSSKMIERCSKEEP